MTPANNSIHRREFIKRAASAALGMSLSARFSIHAAGMPKSRPNIVFIFTDQQHAGMLSCAGNPHLKTPAMDSLAATGVTQAFLTLGSGSASGRSRCGSPVSNSALVSSSFSERWFCLRSYAAPTCRYGYLSISRSRCSQLPWHAGSSRRNPRPSRLTLWGAPLMVARQPG